MTLGGQNVPFDKQTPNPETVAVENVPIFARIWVPVAVENQRSPVDAKFVEVPFVSVVFWSDVSPETVAVPSVTEPADRVLELNDVPVALEKPKFVAKKFVVVAFAPVALVKLTPASEELPVTLSVPVAVRLEVVRPPKSVTLEVAKAPRFVTEARVSASAVAEGQPTPF